MRRLSSPLLLLILLSTFAWAPLLAPGYFLKAHDAAHSLFWLVEFDQGIRDGFLWPRWAPDHALGYGYPLFTFYAPLAFYIAEFFHLVGASIVTAVKLTWALAFVASGISMYRFASKLWGAGPGLVAGLLYLYAPYHFVNIYVRAALAEFVAYALFPWVLHSFWNLLEQATARRAAVAALAFGLMLLTHSVTIILFPPALIALILYWLALKWRRTRLLPWRETGAAIGAGVLGGGLAAIFLLPAVLEGKNIVQAQWLPQTYRYATQFIYSFQLFDPAWGFAHALPGPDDGMSQQVGLWLVALGVAALPLALRRRPPRRGLLAGFGLAAVAALTATQAITLPIWDALSPLALIQFPFRLLALAALFLALAAAGVLAAILPADGKKVPPIVLALSFAIILASYPYTRPQHTPVTDRNQSPAAIIDFETAHPDMRGSTAFASAPPSDSPKLAAYLAGAPLPLAGIIAGSGDVQSIRHGAGSEHVHVHAVTPLTLQFYTYWYPGWQATVDGRVIAIRAEGPNALITMDLPAGNHNVSIRLTNTPLRTAAAAISVLSTLALIMLGTLNFGFRISDFGFRISDS